MPRPYKQETLEYIHLRHKQRMTHNTEVEELRDEFVRWRTAETTFAYGTPDDRTIADWWVEKLHHQLQKAQNEAYTKGRSDEAKTCTGCQGRCEEQLQKARLEAWQEAVDLADKIELREPDGGTKQWMAFKAFRNTLRDRIKDHSNLDHPKGNVSQSDLYGHSTTLDQTKKQQYVTTKE